VINWRRIALATALAAISGCTLPFFERPPVYVLRPGSNVTLPATLSLGDVIVEAAMCFRGLTMATSRVGQVDCSLYTDKQPGAFPGTPLPTRFPATPTKKP
jgi:hypothetical protein